MRGPAKLWVLWGAASMALSACLYLLDLGTTISALVTYYYYQYKCPQAAQPVPPLFRHDPICRIIRSDPHLYSISTEFWACIATLLIAQPIYTFMFWTSLPPRLHPLRLAYFMPLIHLYRLLQLLRYGFNVKKLEELQKEQREANSLYNALAASLETFPQFSIQFYVAMRLGENITGSVDSSVQTQRIPLNLVLSLVASLAAGFYNSGRATLLLMGVHVPLAKKLCVAALVGCQAIALMLVKSIVAATLTQLFFNYAIPTMVYIITGLVISWIFIGIFFRSQYCDDHDSNICFKILHSLVFAIFIRFISPIYVIVKAKKSVYLLILGTLANNLVEIIGIALILIRPGHLKEQESPCHSLHIANSKEKWNKYLTCKMFLGTTFSSFLVATLTTVFFMWLMQNENIARDNLKESSTTHIVCIKSTSLRNTCLAKDVKLRSPHQRSIQTLFGLMLVIILAILMKNMQRSCPMKVIKQNY